MIGAPLSAGLACLTARWRVLVAAAACGLVFPGTASAYIGPSYLQIADVAGGWAGAPFKNWIRVNSDYWQSARGPQPYVNYQMYSGPQAPREGASSLVIAIDKHNPAVRHLMDKCLGKTAIADVRYAKSSALSGGSEIGERPPQMPQYFEYRLTDVHITDCPVVANAPEQAFVISFNAIHWLNYDLPPPGLPPVLQPVALHPEPNPARTRSYVVTWFANANFVSDDQCPVMATKPAPEEYYTYLSAEEAEKERVRLIPGGGPGNAQLAQRGPNRLDVTRLPGIVPDPGQPTPRPNIARGLDLDGKPGIDNRYFQAVGCIPGVQGHRGFITQFSNAQMRDGAFSILIEISGIDDMRNDDSVDVTWFYSQDSMAKSGSGTQVLRDYTFRLADKPEYTNYFTRFHGRIVDGVVITEPIKTFGVYMGKLGFPAAKRFLDARMQLELLPDGSLKGLLGGYQDLWMEASKFTTPAGENQWNYNAPATYNAFKRAADGLKDPATGEYTGISTAYDIEALPAFIASEPPAPRLTSK